MAIKNGAALPFAVNDNVRTIKVYTPYDPELMTTSQIKQIEDTIVAQVRDLEAVDGPIAFEWCAGDSLYLDDMTPAGTA